MYSHSMASGAQTGVLPWLGGVHTTRMQCQYARIHLTGAHPADHLGEAAGGCDEPAQTANIQMSYKHACSTSQCRTYVRPSQSVCKSLKPRPIERIEGRVACELSF
jgi:hypothetical protein